MCEANKLELAMDISLGASRRIARFLAPLLVFIARLIDQELALLVIIAGQIATLGCCLR